MWSAAEAIELRIVVSEIGEQWSPNAAPAKTELTTPTRMVSTRSGPSPSLVLNASARGITNGIMIAMVAQLVPPKHR